jgi:alpha-L-fucosidase 2
LGNEEGERTVVSLIKTHYEPLRGQERAAILPDRGFCSIRPAWRWQDALIVGNGTMNGLVFGDPLHETIMLRHERMLIPQWRSPPAPPRIAHVLPEVKRLHLEGKYDEAADLAIGEALKDGYPESIVDGFGVPNNHSHYGVVIRLDSQALGKVTGFARTLEFGSGEAVIHWTDGKGDWKRRVFASRADNVVVLTVEPPAGQVIDTDIEIDFTIEPDQETTLRRWTGWVPEGLEFDAIYHVDSIMATGRYDQKTVGPKGYAAAARVFAPEGAVHSGAGSLRVEGARSLVIVARLDWYRDIPDDAAVALLREIQEIEPDYDALLERHRAIHAPLFDRVRLELSQGEENTQSSKELQNAQLEHDGLHPSFLEKLFDMGRYYLLAITGTFPSIWGHVNINVNLQIAAGNQAGLPELMESYFRWIEGYVDDFKQNATNIFGCRGILSSVHPDQEHGLLMHFTKRWPHHFWVSGAGWCLMPFWEHYQITGDRDFARNRMLPLYKEIAAFYEDYLTETDEDGRYIFVPSYSPENWPGNLDHPRSAVVNATMDITVCREVLCHLVELCETFGVEKESLPKWRGMLERLPPYLYDDLGALKEWAWKSLEENYDHRHLSHLYGVWPGDEITPDGAPDLVKAAFLANRKRGQGNGSAHGVMHRALIAARLKDATLVLRNLKLIMEQGYVNPGSLMTNHNPYRIYCPDPSGSIPALVIEMLVYSCPGIIEVLPAVPASLRKGALYGARLRTGVIADKLSWDLDANRIDVTVTALWEQEVVLVHRRGISRVEASEAATISEFREGGDRFAIRLPAGKPVNILIQVAEVDKEITL